ncbi:pyridoxamine 5'-phosphate oxidase family protein [Phenylobacterium sp.]|uniref:pyridoxamine 5'-phosphate oxidase family protein n=1 Tax=Phenylobacterium sp. TaxID=1871053 RepID=UPI0035ADB7DC
MANMDLKDVAKTLKDIDFVMLNTHTDGGEIAGRPMSNNRDVEYDGDSWFFVDKESRTFADVSRDPKVTLSAQSSKGLLGKPPVFLSIEGRAEIIEDRAAFAEHWTSDLDRWWPDGPDTPGIALLKVHATRIHYWDGEDEGETPVGVS